MHTTHCGSDSLQCHFPHLKPWLFAVQIPKVNETGRQTPICWSLSGRKSGSYCKRSGPQNKSRPWQHWHVAKFPPQLSHQPVSKLLTLVPSTRFGALAGVELIENEHTTILKTVTSFAKLAIVHIENESTKVSQIGLVYRAHCSSQVVFNAH